MRIQNAGMKRTVLTTVLFYLVFTLMPLAASAETQPTATITLVNNAALKTGQSLGIKEYMLTGDKERLVKNLSIGPVEADCTNGCGTEPGNFNAGPGQYRIEVRTDAETSALTAVTFNVKAGEEYIWMVTNRGNPKATRATAPGMKVISDTGPFRLDLVTYTPALKTETPAATVTHKKPDSGFWPFKPKKRLSAPNN